jgi:hypothetical protein
MVLAKVQFSFILAMPKASEAIAGLDWTQTVK